MLKFKIFTFQIVRVCLNEVPIHLLTYISDKYT